MLRYYVSHNFLDEDETRKLGIQYNKILGSLKILDTLSKSIHSVAYGVPLKIVESEGTIDLMVVNMDGYRMVLGMDFLTRYDPNDLKEMILHISLRVQ